MNYSRDPLFGVRKIEGTTSFHPHGTAALSEPIFVKMIC